MTATDTHSASGYPVVPANYAVRCEGCGARVRAVLDTTGPRPCHVLPINQDGLCADCRQYGIDRSRCTYCHGQPVINAETWLGESPLVAATCPRCGLTAGEGDR